MDDRAIDAELASAGRLVGGTPRPLRAASMGLRLADVTEMPTLRERRHLSDDARAVNRGGATLGVRRVRGKHFFIATTR